MEDVRLDIGCGDKPREGYIGIDRKLGGEAYPLKGPDGQPIADNSVSEAIASHVLEHFSFRQVGEVLREWTRVLKFGGTLKLAVPDFEWIARNHLAGKSFNLQGYLMGGHVDADDHHGCVFDHAILSEAFKELGYRNVRPWKSEVEDCASLPVSLNLMGQKWYRIKPLMSMPRLSFTANWRAWIDALFPLGLLPTSYEGAFWGQCLERVMEENAASHDLLLALDYDTPIRQQDVLRLIRLMHENPQADAIAALQIGRGRDTPLLTMKDDAGNVVTKVSSEAMVGPLAKVHSAHFGATLIRTKALAKVPHPWFHGQPGPDGRWGEGRVDDDMSFWQAWEKAGNTAYVAPGVVVGHGEYVFTFPDENMKPIHQNTGDFFKSGPPAGVFGQAGTK